MSHYNIYHIKIRHLWPSLHKYVVVDVKFVGSISNRENEIFYIENVKYARSGYKALRGGEYCHSPHNTL